MRIANDESKRHRSRKPCLMLMPLRTRVRTQMPACDQERKRTEKDSARVAHYHALASLTTQCTDERRGKVQKGQWCERTQPTCYVKRYLFRVVVLRGNRLFLFLSPLPDRFIGPGCCCCCWQSHDDWGPASISDTRGFPIEMYRGSSLICPQIRLCSFFRLLYFFVKEMFTQK